MAIGGINTGMREGCIVYSLMVVVLWCVDNTVRICIGEFDGGE